MHFTATLRAHPPPLATGVQHFFLDDDEAPAAGSRPDRIGTLSGQQAQVLQRTVEQIVDAVPLVPLLDDPVPQMVEQLLRFFDFLLPVPEQVIEVPKILLDDVPMGTAVRDTQLAEQLVEVPTIVSYSWLQLRMEQNVDIPVPGRGGEFLVFKVFFPGQSSSASSSSPAGTLEVLDEPGDVFFRTIPRAKNVRSWVRTRGRHCSPSRAHPPWQLMWTPGSMATTSGFASTPCMGRFGRSCCRTTCSGTRRGNATDGSTAASGCGSGGYRLCDPPATSSSSLRRTCGWCPLQFIDRVVVLAVILQRQVVDIPVMAQLKIPLERLP